MTDISRRGLLRRSLALGSVLGSGSLLAAVCSPTPAQQEGPFYPQSDLERDADLVQLRPSDPTAKGDIVFIAGTVMDSECTPIAGALVEIWQACHSGRYNHTEDPNETLELDRSFQYWGRAKTDAQGRYKFRTIVPGHYPVGPATYRPPHIHYKVHAPGFKSLTTQMYFDPRSYDDPAIAAIVKKWNDYERVPAALTVLFQPASFLDADAKLGTFDITLRA